jgi:hypothetical protein
LQNEVENGAFYYNNFNNNTQHVFHQPPCLGINKWDNEFIGNFWSNYTGIDANGDGIGDTPYVVNVNNVDRYPLMKPYLFGDVNHDGKNDMMDLWLVAKAYGSAPRKPDWNPHCDIDGNGIINMLDLYIVATRFGEHCP